MTTRRKLTIIGGLVCVVAAASVGSGLAAGLMSSNSAAVPPGYSGMNDPNLAHCLATEPVCNPNASSLQHANAEPWAQPPQPGASSIGRSKAVELARAVIGAPATAQAFSWETTGSQAINLLGIDRSANVDESRPVWIVTVLAPAWTDGSPAQAPQKEDSYSAVVDAATGDITDDCIGCAWLSSSR